MGAGGFQCSQHPAGRRAAAGEAGPEAATAAGERNRHLPRAKGAVLTVLRSVLLASTQLP